jgi:hypothetical protein
MIQLQLHISRVDLPAREAEPGGVFGMFSEKNHTIIPISLAKCSRHPSGRNWGRK